MRKLTIPLLFMLLCSFLLNAQQDEVLVRAAQMPYFPGCEQFENGSEEKRYCSNEALVEFLAEHLEYPEEARSKELEGMVYVSFVITKDGQVTAHKILKDIGEGCGAAALNVIKIMPRWEPGLEDGKKVNVKLNLPVRFALNDESPNEAEGYIIQWGALSGRKVTNEELENMRETPIVVRDPFGNELPTDEILFSYEKNKKIRSARSKGDITKEMMKLLKKAKEGGIFSIVATVQEEGEFIFVDREFDVID